MLNLLLKAANAFKKANNVSRASRKFEQSKQVELQLKPPKTRETPLELKDKRGYEIFHKGTRKTDTYSEKSPLGGTPATVLRKPPRLSR